MRKTAALLHWLFPHCARREEILTVTTSNRLALLSPETGEQMLEEVERLLGI